MLLLLLLLDVYISFFLSFAGTMFVFVLFVRIPLLFSHCHCGCSLVSLLLLNRYARLNWVFDLRACLYIYMFMYIIYLRPLIATKIKICRYNDLASIRLIHSTQHSTEHNDLFHHTHTHVWLHIHNFKLSFLDFCFNFENFSSLLLLLLIHFIWALSHSSSRCSFLLQQ